MLFAESVTIVSSLDRVFFQVLSYFTRFGIKIETLLQAPHTVWSPILPEAHYLIKPHKTTSLFNHDQAQSSPSPVLLQAHYHQQDIIMLQAPFFYKPITPRFKLSQSNKNIAPPSLILLTQLATYCFKLCAVHNYPTKTHWCSIDIRKKKLVYCCFQEKRTGAVLFSGEGN